MQRVSLKIGIVLGLGLAMVGCQSEVVDPGSEDGAVVSRTPATSLGDVVGIAVEGTSDRLFALSATGVLSVFENQAWREVWRAVEVPEGGFTDIAALGQERFAITGVSDGYLIDLADGELQSHFCYEPGFWDPMEFGEPAVQVSEAVAYDAATDTLYAQPQDRPQANMSQSFRSQVASYDRVSGADLSWWDLGDPGFTARGLAVDDTTLLLGADTGIYRFDPANGAMDEVVDLASLGVMQIEGFSLDGNGHWWVLDSGSSQILEIDSSRF
ncbi:MAG: hypothetical protein AAGF12_38305 [Myxococcota bacterium]